MNGVQAVQWRRGAVYALAAALLWPIVETIGATLSRTHAPLQTVWLRYAAHLGVLLALAVPRYRTALFHTRHPRLQLLRGGLMFLMPLAMVIGVRIAPVAGIWAVFWIAPMLVVLAAPLLGETPGRITWAAALIGFAGAVLATGAGGRLVQALLPGTLMAATLAGYVLLSRRLRHESIATSLFYTGLGAFIPLSLLMPWFWRPIHAGDVLSIIMLGCASLLALGCIDRAAESIRASAVAPLLYAAVLFETLLAVVRHGTAPAFPVFAGLAGVLLAIVITVLQTGRAHRSNAAASTSKLERGLA